MGRERKLSIDPRGMHTTNINILAKAPIPGFAKTRLSKDLGESLTHSIYSRLLENLFNELKSLSNISLHITPWNRRELFSQWIQSGWTLDPQAEGDLGNKILTSVKLSFDRGFKKVLVLGTDCPSLSLADLYAADSKLNNSRFVCGPSTDGGYWLIGLVNKPGWESLFTNISWSTDKVFQQTSQKAEKVEAGQFAELHTKSDLDTYEDWVKIKHGPEFSGLTT